METVELLIWSLLLGFAAAIVSKLAMLLFFLATGRAYQSMAGRRAGISIEPDIIQWLVWVFRLRVLDAKLRLGIPIRLVRLPLGSKLSAFLAAVYTQKVYDRVLAEQFTDMQIEFVASLSKGRKYHATWVVVRGHLIVLKVVVEHALASTVGKLIREIVK